jgi:hypothetical protein
MVNGKWLVKDRESTVYESEKIISKGKEELKELLERV